MDEKIYRLARLYLRHDRCSDSQKQLDLSLEIESLEEKADPVCVLGLQCEFAFHYLRHDLDLAEHYLGKAVSFLSQLVGQTLALELMVEEAQDKYKKSRLSYQIGKANLTQNSRWN